MDRLALTGRMPQASADDTWQSLKVIRSPSGYLSGARKRLLDEGAPPRLLGELAAFRSRS
jgi:hypothetical protein